MTINIRVIAEAAVAASRTLATLSTGAKNALLQDVARRVDAAREAIFAANAIDMSAARAAGLATAKLRRLEVTPASLAQLIEGLHQIAALPDPVGQVTSEMTRPNGLRVRRVRTSLGVIAMIFEARPLVTLDAFALCFKSGNACILKGGKEAAQTAAVLANFAHESLLAHNLPQAAITVANDWSRENVAELIALEGLIDLAIPRGGPDLINFVRAHAKVPCIFHAAGVCHVFIDAAADAAMAISIVVNGKTSAPATCNATECVLVHASAAARVLPALAGALSQANVVIHADERARALMPNAHPATHADWGREYLDLEIAVRVVDSLEDALAHIARYSSDHTEAIVTSDQVAAERFVAGVRSSCTVVNASTRFNDGFQLGLGAEVGISTSRLHAYGPMGLGELTTTRFVVEGSGQIR
ncbi:gamma-glutamyl phosphate reductase [Phycisphaerae bacterium]|nr:gamma-glutamyl phosphate reductase [Phycisphaerae bacterium]